MTRAVFAKSLSSVSVAFGLATAVMIVPAAAQSVRDQVLAVTKGTLEAAGAKEVVWGQVAGDDARFTVTGSTVRSEAEGKKSTLNVQTLTFVGAKPTADGGFTADEIDFDKVTMEDDDAKVTIDRASVNRVTGRSPAVVKASKGFAEMVEAFDLTGVVIVSEDGKTVPIAAVHGVSSEWIDGIPRKGAFELRGLTVPLDPKDESLKELTALGYTSIGLDVALAGTWDDRTGRLDVQQSISATDMGALRTAFVLGGLTPDVIAKMRNASEDQAKQMELLQGLMVEKASIRWEDASLTGRVLTKQAKDQAVDVPTYTKQLKLMMPMLLSMVGNKEFEGKVAKAGGAFLDAPKSLTVSVTPTQPLPVSQIMGAAMMAPQSLPTVLGADVRAND